LQAEEEMCGRTNQEAFHILTQLERQTAPGLR
jgi:hypothetical protein